MALEKVNYEDKKTPITAKNLNDIQDAIIELEENAATVDDVLAAIPSAEGASY